MFIKKFLVGVGVLLGLLITGTAQAYTLTGTVAYYFTQDASPTQVYTFVNVLTPTGNGICYYVGLNTAYATIFAAKQISGKGVTVNCDSSSKITQVQN